MSGKQLLADALYKARTNTATPLRAPTSILPAADPVQAPTQGAGYSLLPEQSANPLQILQPAINSLKASESGANSLEAMRTAIRSLESNGNYTVASKKSSASGAYQYIDGTWAKYGGYARARDAPPDVQDKKFTEDMGRYLKQYNGNVKAAAIAWFQGPGVANKYIKGDTSVLGKTDANGTTTSAYADRIAAHVEKLMGAQQPAPVDIGTTASTQNGDEARKFLAGYRTDPSKDVNHFSDSLATGLSALIAAAPGKVSIYSGYRSPEKQATLYAAALKKYGSPEAARKWVAPPGKSQHGEGNASDLQFDSPATKKWVHDNAARFGLAFPLSNEDWHIEPVNARQKK